MNQEKIGKYIALKRKEKNMTQAELAEKLGVTDRSISNWENGKHMPDLSLFKPLCEELNITINDLMSGEKIDEKSYINTLEENIVNMVSNLEHKKKRKFKILILLIITILILPFIGRTIYLYYEIDVEYDSKVMSCNINNNELNFIIQGQSVLNTYHTTRKIDGEQVYFFHSTVNLYNKRRSNWEYSKSMIRSLDSKNVQFGYKHTLDTISNNTKVYYTDYKIKQIKQANETEIKNIIKDSYLMCSN